MVMRKALNVLIVALLVGAGFAARAEAAPIVSVSPSAQIVNDNATVNVDILISGLTEVMGYYEFGLSFDPAILSGTTFSYNAGQPMGASPDVIPPTGFTSPGFFTLAVGADFAVMTAAELAPAQGAGFVLASLSFLANNNGVNPLTSLLTLSGVFLTNFEGTTLYECSTTNPDCVVTNGAVTVNGSGNPDPDPVPEPASLALIGAGIAALAIRRRSA